MFFRQVAIHGAIPFRLTTYTQNGFTPEEEAEINRISEAMKQGEEIGGKASSFSELEAELLN